ncbi:MAG: metal-dependent hydrolase [Candidatus Omnitrophica bacterium]|nr:metal-dependent hydrolase [Candidatus Omnitrophota bacterium]
MKPIQHTWISACIGAGLGLWFKSWPASLMCLLSGVLIDLDHYVDYSIVKGEFPFRYKDLVDFCKNQRVGGLYIILHSFEFIIIFFILDYYYQFEVIWLCCAIGMAIHLLCDHLTNPVRPLAYFLTYRLYYSFRKKHLYKKEYYAKMY